MEKLKTSKNLIRKKNYIRKQNKRVEKQNKFISKYKKPYVKKENFFLIKRAIKFKPYGRKFLRKAGKESSLEYTLSIVVKPNNIFCLCACRKTGKTLLSCSSGKYNVKTSKKNLRFTFKIVLNIFFKALNSTLNLKSHNKGFIIVITAPIKMRRTILYSISNNLKKRNLLIKVNPKKCFNGCRPPKRIRKKRAGLRLLK